MILKTIQDGKIPVILANLPKIIHITKLTEFQFITVFVRSKKTIDQPNFIYNIENNDLQITAELLTNYGRIQIMVVLFPRNNKTYDQVRYVT